MLYLSAKIRENLGKKVKLLREKEKVPAVLYGPKIKNLNLELDLKEFSKVLNMAGESSLIDLEIEGKKEKYLVLIHDVQLSPVAGKAIHVDLYQPALDEKIEVTVPIIIEGESFAVKTLGGTLVRNITEIEVKALPQKLPKEIKVNITGLKTFGDYILIKDLQIPEGVQVLRDSEEILISVSAPEKEEERIKPTEEKPVAEGEKAEGVSAQAGTEEKPKEK